MSLSNCSPFVARAHIHSLLVFRFFPPLKESVNAASRNKIAHENAVDLRSLIFFLGWLFMRTIFRRGSATFAPHFVSAIDGGRTSLKAKIFVKISESFSIKVKAPKVFQRKYETFGKEKWKQNAEIVFSLLKNFPNIE